VEHEYHSAGGVSVQFPRSQFQWNPPQLLQEVSDDPSLENLSASIRYFPPEGRLGSVFTAIVQGSSDATKDFALFRSEVWVEFTSPPSFQGGDLPVSAEFETNAAELRLLDYQDEYGTSDLKVEWKVEPYATTGYPKDQRTYGKELASGFEVPPPLFSGAWLPQPTERRDFILPNVTPGVIRFAVGIDHMLAATSNDYTYTAEASGDFSLNWIGVEIG
jgi:hypothetical protein